MKQFYSFFFKTLLSVSLISYLNRADAQIAGVTTVSNSGNCSNVAADFNTNDNSFSSPSPYYGNSSFYHNSAQGWWSEVDGIHTVPPIPGGGGLRLISIISPFYTNPNAPGTFDVGFHYIVPNPAVNRFQIRIFSANLTGSPTVYSVDATTGFLPFAAYSTPTAYTGGAPQVTGMEGNICLHLMDQDISNAPGTGYNIEVTYEVGEPQFSVFDNLSIGATAAAPLPVNFLGVAADRADNGIKVRWSVGDELNVQQYDVEKSIDAKNFSKIGTVDANKEKAYSFVDGNIKAEQFFYRIKSVDIDGSVKYSGIVRFKNSSSYSDNLLLYPSPASNLLTIQHSKLNPNAKIIVSTIDGRILKTVQPSGGLSNSMVDVSSLSSGMYIIRLDDGKGTIQTATFIKQ
jgi:hypothetical protein